MSAPSVAPLRDTYPTRLDHAAQPIARIEPTVWATEFSGPLDAGALETMDRRGYLLRPSTVGPDWIPPLTQELERIGSALGDDPRIIREPGGSVRSIFQPHLLSEVIEEVLGLDTVLPVARQLLGSDVYLHQARINVMPGFVGTGFYWHSDFETWHAEDGMPSMRAVSCSISLSDNFPYNGALMVMPGSHRTFYPCVGQTPADNHRNSLVKQELGVPDRATLTEAATRFGIDQAVGTAGTGLWFDSNLMHGSGSNITPFPRSNVFLVFNSVENQLGHPYAAASPRPEYLAAREVQPLRSGL
ncbi:ectoine hydroxylase [Mycolicibacterium tokaiense]|uniref:Ectoine hydroxylase n=1 Tax=Mycolicibacterium tokaiense TaxID=39695 RepID=A0A378TJ57_9MYCO|nr:ectoine hydroxylase [Mycolicibacterium tokaiense]BBY84814.1 ectoine hydroxylase [Mycolicibacterium tokaiense]STZ60680.1 ectoine hydroxylase [Mycolicibacterium tokaiense]